MADFTATFALDLEGNARGVAMSHAQALDTLRDKIHADTAALRGMESALKNLNLGGVVNIKTARELRDRIAAQKNTIAATQSQFLELGGSFDGVRKASKATKGGLDTLNQAAQAAGGPIGSLVSRFGRLSALMGGGLIAGGILAIAAAVAALTVATFAAVGALTIYAIKQADARRSELLRLEGLTKIRHWMFGVEGATGRAADKASFLQQTIDRVSGSVALGRDKIAGMTEELYKMGLRGGNLQQALEGMAITAAVQGDAQAQAFAQWAASAALTGGSVKRLADDVRARLGGIAKAQLLSLGVQAEKLRENFGALFRDLKIEALLEGLASVTELFSQSTYTGRALKALVDGLLQPLINSAVGGAPLMKRFFQGIVIAALTMGIVILKIRNWFRDTFGGSEILKGFDMQKVAVYAGMLAFTLLAAAVGSVVAGLLTLAAIVAVAVAPFVGLVALITHIADVVNEIGWAGLGQMIVRGIADGVTSGAQWVIDAISNLASATVKTFKDKLGISSPSRVMIAKAAEVPAGIEQAYQAGRGPVSDAAAELAAPPPVGAAAAAGPATAGAGATINVHIDRVEVGSRDDVDDVGSRLIEAITTAFEGVHVTLGAKAAA